MTTIYGDYYADLAVISAIKAFGIDMRYFLEHKERRLKECVIIKGVAQKLLYDEKKFTLENIARLFKRTHATILNNIRASTNLKDTDKNYSSKFTKARKIFLNYLADSD